MHSTAVIPCLQAGEDVKTTLAMIFGMVPLAFALTEGSEQRAPWARR